MKPIMATHTRTFLLPHHARQMPRHIPRSTSSHVGPFHVLRFGPYRYYWFAAASTFTGFMMQIVVRGWLVYDLSGSPFQVSLVTAMLMLPMLLLSLVGGVLADRLNRKNITLAAEALTFATFALLAVLVVSGVVQVWHILLLSSVNGIGFALSGPARQALVPSLVPSRYVGSAVALSSTVFSVAQILGPALGGTLVSVFGVSTAFVVSAGFALPAMVLYAQIRPRHTSGVRHGGRAMRGSLGAAFAYIRASALMRWVMLGNLVVVIAVMPWQALLPVFATDVLNRGATTLGMLGLATGIGALVGSVTVAAIGARVGYHRLGLVSGVAAAVVVASFGASASLGLSLALAAGAGLSSAMFMTANMTLLQITVPDHLRGRINSVRFLVIGTQPIGTIFLGAFAESSGPQLAVFTLALAGGVAFVLLAVVMHVARGLGTPQPAAAG